MACLLVLLPNCRTIHTTGTSSCLVNMLVTGCLPGQRPVNTWSTQVKGENTNVNVKRLPKKPAPPRFGRKLTARQSELASHICVGA